MKIEVPVSIGELFDKLTILEIKHVNIKDEEKRANVDQEREELWCVVEDNVPITSEIQDALDNLFEINTKLWHVEDKLREIEATGQFGFEFIELARQVYQLNDRRFELKQQINQLTDSDVIEEKQHPEY